MTPCPSKGTGEAGLERRLFCRAHNYVFDPAKVGEECPICRLIATDAVRKGP